MVLSADDYQPLNVDPTQSLIVCVYSRTTVSCGAVGILVSKPFVLRQGYPLGLGEQGVIQGKTSWLAFWDSMGVSADLFGSWFC